MKKITTILLVMVMLITILNGIIFSFENADAATNVSGKIVTNTTWTAINSPYIVIGDVIVDNGTTLTIEPGVTVMFDGLYSLIVNGTLNATGTAGQPLIFTSNQSSPMMGDWLRIRLHGKNNTMDYCEISFGNYPLYVMGHNSNNSISNCKIFNNTGDGIYLKETSNNTMDNVSVSFSNSNGISLVDSEYNFINNSIVKQNKAFGIYLRTSRYNTFKNTNISNNSGKGIKLSVSSDHIEMQNLTVLQNNDMGIDLGGNSYNNISYSLISDNNGRGIYFGGNSEYQIIKNCKIQNNIGNGIDLGGSNYSDILGCNISKNTNGIFSYYKVTNINIINSEIWNNSDGIDLVGARHINISNSKITENRGDGIRFLKGGIQDNVILNCTIKGNTYGINFYDNDKNSAIQNNRIFFNKIYLNSQYGIHFNSSSDDSRSIIQNNYIYNNEIYLNELSGIYFYIGYYYHSGPQQFPDNYSIIQENYIFNNLIHSNNGNGIHFKSSGSGRAAIYINKIYNNSIHSNKQGGVYFNMPNDWTIIRFNQIYDNNIYLNYHNGIYFQSIHSQWGSYPKNDGNNIYSNHIYSNGQNGIYFNIRGSDHYYNISNLMRNNISLNKIFSNGQYGIYFLTNGAWVYDNRIYSNTIYLNNYSGIYIAGGPIFDNNKIYSNTIYSNGWQGLGIYFGGPTNRLFFQNNEIYSNTIFSHTNGAGIYLRSGPSGTTWQTSNVYNNTIYENENGIILGYIKSHIFYENNISNNLRDGIYTWDSSFNSFIYNSITNNNWSGFKLSSYSAYNKIQKNNITSNNQSGIIISSNYNKIIRNKIAEHSKFGINITNAKYNTLHHNNFINNTKNAYDSSNQLNNWDDGAEGNWWSDYTGFDSNTDGIGDIPYDIPGWGSKDWYPLMTPVNISGLTVENTTPVNGVKNVLRNIQISITFSNEMNKTATENAISISGGFTLTNFVWSNYNKTVTFKPSSTLESSTTYLISVSIVAKDVLDNFLDGTYQFSFRTEDVVAPKIISTQPVHNSNNINLNAKIIVTFSEPMNKNSVTYSCSPNPGGWSVVWNSNDTIATYSHTSFGSSTQYTFRITGGKDLGGNDLVAGPVANPWSFTTKDVVGPEITAVSPANSSTNVLLDANVVVTFNEKMNTSSVTFSCAPDPSGWSVLWTNNDKTVTYSHNLFINFTTYTFRITAGKDLSGNALNPSLPNPWSFTTKDLIFPNITATSPSNGAYDVPLNTNAVVAFSEEIDKTTLTFTCNPDPGGWSIVWSGGNTIATFTHNSFKENINYTFQVTNAKDLAKNNLVPGKVPNPWSFKTENLAAPQIIATMPANNSVDVPLNAKIVVTFSEAMNIGTVAFSCSPNPGGWSVSWNSGNTIVTYTHNLFTSKTRYTFRITAGKDIDGKDLNSSIIPNPWSFTSMDIEPPEIISVSPINGSTDVVTTANIVVTFNEPMEKTTVSFTCSPNPTGWTVVWSTSDTVATFMHIPFQTLTTYSFQITSGKDLSANNLALGPVVNPWSFTTKKNAPPTILSEPLKNATERIEYFYDVEAYDPDDDVLKYYLVSQPSGMTINESNGKIIWTPTDTQIGRNPVVVLVSDGGGGIDIQSFNITVVNVNDPPIIITTYLTNATQDKQFFFTIEVLDVDENDDLIFSLPNAPEGMSIDSTTGIISWVPNNDQVGLNSVIVIVSDGNGGMDTQSFNITVENVNDLPTITSTPIITATQNKQYSYQVMTADIDVNDVLRFSLPTAPSGITINSSTGVIKWVPNNDQVGSNSIVVMVSDANGGTDAQSFNITVENVNDLPTITSTPITITSEDVKYVYAVKAEDIDIGDILTYDLLTHPTNMVIDSVSGIISWTPTNNQVGFHTIVVKVKDVNEDFITQLFVLTVTNVNDPPIITSKPITSAYEDLKYIYEVIASDIDPTKDNISFSLETYPEGMAIDLKTGIVTWTPSYDQIGENNVIVLVSDNNNGQDSQSFIINVINTNDIPIIVSTPITSIRENEQYEYQLIAQDEDINDVLTYKLEKYPDGMSIDKNTGFITWIPTIDQIGFTSVTIKVIDSYGGTVRQSFGITLISINDPPKISSFPVTSAEVNIEYYYGVKAIDNDPTNDDLIFSLTTNPNGMVINPKTGIITWTPTKDQVGEHNIVIQVSDGNNGTATQSFTIYLEYSEIPEQQVEQKKDDDNTGFYGMFIIIIILVMIFISLLFILFKKNKQPQKQNVSSPKKKQK